MQIIRVKGEFEYSALTMFRAFINPEIRQGYDKNIASTRAVKMLGANFSMSYQKTFKILTVSPRDLY